MRWLITGCSSGLGLSLARAVLEQEDQELIATSRNPSSTPELVKEISSHPQGAWAALDVSSADVEIQLKSIIAQHGPIDVLVNNAGFAAGGVFEATPIDVIRQMYETNFFGVVRLMQGAIPDMRSNGKGGTIVNVSSSEFWSPHAGASGYASTKWALEGISEALTTELSAFGIRILIAEPGNMRTSFVDPAKVAAGMVPMPDAYKGTMVDYVLQAIIGSHGLQELDPDLAAQAIVKEVIEPTVVNSDGLAGNRPLLRLQLGKDTVEYLQAKLQILRGEEEMVKGKALACN